LYQRIAYLSDKISDPGTSGNLIQLKLEYHNCQLERIAATFALQPKFDIFLATHQLANSNEVVRHLRPTPLLAVLAYLPAFGIELGTQLAVRSHKLKNRKHNID
jgi:hypothetical protein